MTPRTCPICGREFEPLSSSHKYCSRACWGVVKTAYNKAARARQAAGEAQPLSTPRVCQICGVEFEPRCWRQTICRSVSCVRERNRRLKIKQRSASATCVVCNKAFDRAPGSARTTCSQACRDKLSGMTQRNQPPRPAPITTARQQPWAAPTDTFCSEFPSWDCAAMDPLTNRMEPGVWVNTPDAAPALRRTAA